MARKSYFRDILSVFGSNVSVTFSNLIIGIILSRVLGAAGFGLYSSLIVVPVIVVGFTQLGIRRSTIYHIGQKDINENHLASALILLWFYTSALSIIICGLVFFFSANQPYDPLLVVLVLLSIPLLLMNLFAGGIFLGKEEILRANIINAGPALLTLLLTVLFVWLMKLSVLGAFIAIAVANFLMFFFVYRTIIGEYRYKITWKYHEGLMKSMVKLGLVNAVSIFVMQLNYRIDVLMLKKLSSLEQVGFYSLATQIAEQIWHIPHAIEAIVLSRSANTDNDDSVTRVVASIFRLSMIFGVLVSVIIFYVTPFFIPLIFGKDFVSSVPMIQAILPGVLILVGFRILNSRLTGKGKPEVAIYCFVPALVINFIANIFLIPKFGGMGAVWSTNISYSLGSVAFLIVYSKKIKMPVSEILTFRKSDFLFFRDIKLLRRKKAGTNP
ncbi:MAG: polysaccharide biosynthesis C-terminal domain-containing protein [Bacteroidetes bacterium]|nr:polysaccharide biosynthesis C-terminal domain-containing protein [Bacteroidota bacterium]